MTCRTAYFAVAVGAAFQILLLCSFQAFLRAPRNLRSVATRHEIENAFAPARIFYVVLIHDERTLNSAPYLFESICEPTNIVIIHLDKKLEDHIYDASVLNRTLTGETSPTCTVHVEKVHDAEWGKFSMLYPTLWAMTKAVQDYAGQWDVFVDVSGDSIPVYQNDYIAQFLSQSEGAPNAGINFLAITSTPPVRYDSYPSRHLKHRVHKDNVPTISYTDDDGTRYEDSSIKAYLGSQWNTLLPMACEYIVEGLNRTDSLPYQYREHLISTNAFVPDECFIPTLIRTRFPESMPYVEDVKFTPDTYKGPSIRFERWTAAGLDGVYTAAEGSPLNRKLGPPYFLGMNDLEEIHDSGALYARKVSPQVDENILKILPAKNPDAIPRVSWPPHDQIRYVKTGKAKK